MRARRFPAPLILLVAASLLLAACGGANSSSSEDEDQITEVIQTTATSTDPADCEKLQTQAFNEQTSFETGDAALAQCKQDATDSSDDPDSVEVSKIEVDGDTATADAAVTGGPFDGSTLTFSLVKEGEQWKLDGIDDIPEFDREALVASFEQDLSSAGDVPQQVADCITQALGSAGEEEIKTAFLSGDGDQVSALFADCIPSG